MIRVLENGYAFVALSCAIAQVSAQTVRLHSGCSIETGEARVAKGYEDMQQQRYRKAADEFRAALDLDPNLFRARYQLAICYFAMRERKQSRREFERLLTQTEPDPSVTYYLGRLDLDEGELGSAIHRLRSIASHPPFPDTAYYLGSAYMKRGELILAERWLQEAEKASPRDFRIPDHLARVYQRNGRRTDAETEYARSTSLRRNYDEASQQAVRCNLELETQPATQARPGCQALFDAMDVDKLTTLGMLYGQHGDYQAAIQPLLLAAKLDPDSWEIQHDIGLSYFRLRRYADARLPLERAAKLRPDFFGSTALLGATLYTLKYDDAAYNILKRAHRLNPSDRDSAGLLFRATLALAQREHGNGDYVECLKYLQEAARLQPGDAETHRRLADIYRLLGRSHEAEQEAREAGNLASNSKQP